MTLTHEGISELVTETAAKEPDHVCDHERGGKRCPRKPRWRVHLTPCPCGAHVSDVCRRHKNLLVQNPGWKCRTEGHPLTLLTVEPLR